MTNWSMNEDINNKMTLKSLEEAGVSVIARANSTTQLTFNGPL